ncbi:Uncharacterised protein [uncultured archaeon]|nr:Uncharacterised protein [uncultured archaeon]
MKISTIWKILIGWFLIVCLIFLIAKNYSVFVFGITAPLILGLLPYFYRNNIKNFFKRVGLHNVWGFFLVAFIITVLEESYCYILGNEVAYPVLSVDVFLVFIIWLGWFGTWYFWISKKYSFTSAEAILAAGLPGVLYEYVSKPEFLANPLGVLIAFPLSAVIYSAIFVIPMQTLDIRGKKTGWRKYFDSLVIPFLISLPLAIAAILLLGIKV